MTSAVSAGEGWSEAERLARHRLVRAALACITERGYADATLANVAARAGVSAADAQQYFANRENLLMDAFDYGMQTLRSHLEDSQILGVTIEERIDSFATIVGGFYGDRRYLAALQIQLNLMNDPALSERTVSSLAVMARVAGPAVEALIAEVFDGAVSPTEEFVALLFFALRGLALSYVVNDALPGAAAWVQKPLDWTVQRRLLVRGLSAVYRDLAVGKVSAPLLGDPPGH
jgi:AcrR family transcriptional regulator